MRTGKYEDRPLTRGTRRQDPRGYWQVYLPEHPLVDSTGHVWEHRKVAYERYGEALPPCELCGKLVTWKNVHIDHEDEDPSNNASTNLRPLCRGCNVSRPMRAKSIYLTVDGVTKNAMAWSKDPKVNISYATILKRKAAGKSDFDVLFGEKATHNGKKPVPAPRKTNFKHERSNAVALTINGVTKTATEWSREPGCTVTDGAIRFRVRQGWPHDKAIFAPPKAMKDRTVATVRNELGRFESITVPKSGD